MKIALILLLIIYTALGYRRSIDFKLDATSAITTGLTSVLDVNNTKAVESGLYTRTEINGFLTEAKQHLLVQFGQDLSSASFNPTLGSWHTSVLDLFPYGTGFGLPTTVITDDSKHANRADSWTVINVGFIAVLKTSGTFSSGLSVGQKYTPGDLIAWQKLNLVSAARNFNIPNQREVITLTANVPSKQVTDGRDKTQQNVVLDCFDSEGKGVYMSSSAVLAGGEVKVRSSATWDN